MPSPRLPDAATVFRSIGPLGETLIQLAAQAEPDARGRADRPAPDTRLPFDWHERWADQQDQIAERLALIEQELNRLTAPSAPQLSVFAE